MKEKNKRKEGRNIVRVFRMLVGDREASVVLGCSYGLKHPFIIHFHDTNSTILFLFQKHGDKGESRRVDRRPESPDVSPLLCTHSHTHAHTRTHTYQRQIRE